MPETLQPAPAPFAQRELDPWLVSALAEDLGCGAGEVGPALFERGTASEVPRRGGDATTRPLFGTEIRGRAALVAKQSGVLCGIDLFLRVFELLGDVRLVGARPRDAQPLEPGQRVCELTGAAVVLLAGERTALNVLQRLSGIATLTSSFVAAVREAGQADARILDTRKTTPGWRKLEKYAVRTGGGTNHRFGLNDEAMVKDNHADLCAAHTGVETLVAKLRATYGPEYFITAEARDETTALAAVAADADCVLLDNMDPAALRRAVERLRSAAAKRPRRLWLEASGGVTLDTVGAVAASGVDRISVGALTHSAPALDLSLRIVPEGEA